MTYNAQRFWTRCYSKVPPDHERGVSSIGYTQVVFQNLDSFFLRHGFTSMFDAGCNDCKWIKNKALPVRYQGGDISLSAITQAMVHTNLDVMVHDIRKDPIPQCDLLWVRDVMIHLSNQDRRAVLLNWLRSDIPWIMMTQIDDVEKNQDIIYDGEFYTTEVNWYDDPWNFPVGVDHIVEQGSRKMELWNRDQIQDLPCLK